MSDAAAMADAGAVPALGPDLRTLDVGAALQPLALPPLTRLTLALYCGASGDHNPIHVDIDFAKQAGLGDVIAHGMLSMGWLGRLVTGWAPQQALRSLGTRFVAMTRVGDRIECSGRVVERFEAGGERRLRIALQTADQHGEMKLVGEAVIAVG